MVRVAARCHHPGCHACGDLGAPGAKQSGVPCRPTCAWLIERRCRTRFMHTLGDPWWLSTPPPPGGAHCRHTAEGGGGRCSRGAWRGTGLHAITYQRWTRPFTSSHRTTTLGLITHASALQGQCSVCPCGTACALAGRARARRARTHNKKSAHATPSVACAGTARHPPASFIQLEHRH